MIIHRCFDKSAVEGQPPGILIPEKLNVTLNPEHEAVFEALHSLNNTITAASRNPESWSKVLDGLVMVAVYNQRFRLDNFEKTA